jgi:hypothetical protein
MIWLGWRHIWEFMASYRLMHIQSSLSGPGELVVQKKFTLDFYFLFFFFLSFVR